VSLILLAMGFGAAACGKRFRLYSITTIVTLVALGVLTGLDAPRLQANLPTPLLGVWERIMIGLFLIWVVVPAIVLLREKALRQAVYLAIARLAARPRAGPSTRSTSTTRTTSVARS